MTTRSRAENRREIEADIVRLGREHLRTHGAAALSLRAIARDLGMVSSAVYRYVASRDDLLTLLLVEGYTDLADAVDAAVGTAGTDARKRLRAAATATRTWAVADPSRWALLYGSPVPGYAAPADRTTGPGTRLVGRILTILDEDHRERGIAAAAPDERLRTLAPDLAEIRTAFSLDLPDAALSRAVGFWATLIGAVSLEVFGQYGSDTFREPAALFDVVVTDAVTRVLGD